MNANAEKKVITFTCAQVITHTYTQRRTNMDTREDGKNGFYPLKEKTTDTSFFFREIDGFCPFP